MRTPNPQPLEQRIRALATEFEAALAASGADKRARFSVVRSQAMAIADAAAEALRFWATFCGDQSDADLVPCDAVTCDQGWVNYEHPLKRGVIMNRLPCIKCRGTGVLNRLAESLHAPVVTSTQVP